MGFALRSLAHTNFNSASFHIIRSSSPLIAMIVGISFSPAPSLLAQSMMRNSSSVDEIKLTKKVCHLSSFLLVSRPPPSVQVSQHEAGHAKTQTRRRWQGDMAMLEGVVLEYALEDNTQVDHKWIKSR